MKKWMSGLNRTRPLATPLAVAGVLACLAAVLWDSQLTAGLMSLSRRLSLADSMVVLVAKWMVVLLGFVWLVYSSTKEDWFGSLAETGFALGLAFLIGQLLQASWYRDAPFVALGLEPLLPHARDASFPSDHATVVFVLATSLFLLSRRVGYVGFVLAMCTGLARVYCSLHWVSDILAGASLGVATRLVTAWISETDVIQRPDRGILRLTGAARSFACLWLLYYFLASPLTPGRLWYRIQVNWLFVLLWLGYAVVCVVLWGENRRHPQGPLPDPFRATLNRSELHTCRRLLWIQVCVDVLFFTVFCMLTLDVRSPLFLLYTIPLLSGLGFSDFRYSLKIFVGVTTCLLVAMVVITMGSDGTFSIPFLAGTLFLPRAATLFVLTVAFGWQINRDERWRSGIRTLSDSAGLLNSLVDNVPLNIYRIDKERRLTFVNKQYCETIAKPSYDVLGKRAADLYPPDLARIYDADDEKVLSKGLVVSQEEPHEPPGKRRIVVHVIKTPIYDPSGQITGLQGVFWDVSPERAAQESLKLEHGELARTVHEMNLQLAQVMERLRANEQMSAMLLKEVHHRIRNNLYIISDQLDEIDDSLAMCEGNPEAWRAMIRSCRGRLTAMGSVHEHLYKSADQSAVNMDGYLSLLTSNLCTTYGDKARVLTVRVGVTSSALDVSTAEFCGVIVAELVSNSIEHAFPDGQSGEIIVELTQEPSQMLALGVYDTGVGTTGERIAESRSGLGLVRDLVTWAGGTMEVLPAHGMNVKIRFGPLGCDDMKG
jgi:PAS domain S-box-containing protein